MHVFKKKLVYLLAALSLFSGLSSHAETSEQLKIKAAIKNLQPHISNKDLQELTLAFSSLGNHGCDIDWPLLMSIAFNESSLIKTTVNKKSNDYGLMQLNEKTINRLKINKTKLLTSAAYALQRGCELLMWNREKFSARHEYWLGIYRAGVALHKKRIRDSAISYDNIIRKTAAEIEKFGLEELVSAQ